MDVNVKVAVRCRPMSAKETAKECRNIISIADGKRIAIANPESLASGQSQPDQKEFTFDHCYGPDSTQEAVFADLGQPIVAQALDGFNGTIFAYGQTGSGKSFSMMGAGDTKGIIPQLNDHMFVQLESMLRRREQEAESSGQAADTKFLVTVSFLEVYNEEIKDLLNPSDKKLKIHENPKRGIYVEGLCELVTKFSPHLICTVMCDYDVCDYDV